MKSITISYPSPLSIRTLPSWPHYTGQFDLASSLKKEILRSESHSWTAMLRCGLGCKSRETKELNHSLVPLSYGVYKSLDFLEGNFVDIFHGEYSNIFFNCPTNPPPLKKLSFRPLNDLTNREIDLPLVSDSDCARRLAPTFRSKVINYVIN